MNMTPEINAILDDLAQLCIQAAKGESATSSDRIDSLASSLAMNGWERKSGEREPLSVQLRRRIEEVTSTRPTYHAEQLEGIIQNIQKAYDRAIRFRSSVPEEQKPPAKKTEDQAASPLTTNNVNTRF